MIIAAIDIGTNSTRLLVGEIEVKNGLKILERGLITTRIGQGPGSNGKLSDKGMERTLRALQEFAKVIKSYPVEMVKVVATSAVRDAGNRDQFLQMVKGDLGWDVEVLPGSREAWLSYLGVTRALFLPVNSLVIDVGGGSTEAIWLQEGEVHTFSVNAGAVRMTDGGYNRKEIHHILEPLLDLVWKIKPKTAIGVGGTVTTLAAIDQQLTIYNPEKIHGYNLPAYRVSQILQDLSGMDLQKRLGIPGLQPQRADVIIAGVTIVDIILLTLNMKTLIASESDILAGLIFDAIETSLN